jgi:hypothetical protein
MAAIFSATAVAMNWFIEIPSRAESYFNLLCKEYVLGR